MADDVPYRVEPAKSNRSACKVCKEKIEKDELRFGSLVDMGLGHGSYHWRQLKCITVKQALNVEEKLGGSDSVGGFAELTATQAATFRKAFDLAKNGLTPKGKAKAKDDKAKAKAKAKADALKAAKLKAKEKAKAKAKAKADAKAKAREKAAAAKAKAKAKAKARGSTTARGAAPTKAPTAEEQHKFLDHARNHDFTKVRELVEANPGYANAQPGGRWTALHQAAEKGDRETVKFLLAHGASKQLKNSSGQTPYEVAHANCKALLEPAEPAEPPAKRARDA